MDQRISEALTALDAAGDTWPRLARSWPDTVRVRRGRWQGQAWVRPAVVLDGEHPRFIGAPVVLLRHEDGTWFHKGTRQGRL